MTEQKKSGRGCFFYGCLSFVGLIVVVLIGGYATFRYFTGFAADEPVVLPEVTVAPAQQQSLRARFQDLGARLDAGTLTEPVEITADDINGVIHSHPELEKLRDHVFVRMEGDAISADVSIPIDETGLSKELGLLEGKYLNGSVSLVPEVVDGEVTLSVKSFTANGRTVPEYVLRRIETRMRTDPEAKAALKKLGNLRVRDGKLVIDPGGAAEEGDEAGDE